MTTWEVDAGAGLLKAAHDLAPLVADESERIERERRIPLTLLTQLIEAGLFRMLVPAWLGGCQADPLTLSAVLQTLAAADASTAWCIGQASGCGMVAALLTRPIAQAIFGNPGTILAWGPGSGTALIVDGGYRLSGHWSFASGSHNATWLGGYASVMLPDGTPLTRADGHPRAETLLFPATDVVLEDIWDVSGLRGTASDAYTLHDHFVPDGYAVHQTGIAGSEANGPLYAFSTSNIFPIAFASVALGIARAALDAFLALAQAKTPRGTRSRLRDNARVQAGTARAEAELRAATLYLQQTVTAAWASAQRHACLPPRDRVAIRLAATFTIDSAARVTDYAYHAAGATAIFASQPFERRFRDMHAVAQQVQGSEAHFESVGRFLFGLEPDSSFL